MFCYFRNIDMSIASIIISCKIANSFIGKISLLFPIKLPRDDYCIFIDKSSVEMKKKYFRPDNNDF